MDQINGNHRAFESMQARAQQAFGEFVSAFLNEAMLSGKYLQPGYKGTVIFSNKANPHGDIILSNANLSEVFDALRRRVASAGLSAPAMHSGAAAAPKQDEGEMAMRLVNMAAAMRRAMMFLSLPSNEAPREILRKALLEPANAQQVRDVVAGYLSTMPAFSGSHPEEAVLFLDKLAAGADVVTMSNTVDVSLDEQQPSDSAWNAMGQSWPEAMPKREKPRDVWNDTKQQWEPKA